MKSILVSIAITAVLLSSASFSFAKGKNVNERPSRCCCPPPQPPAPQPLIIGSFALNETLNDLPSFSVLAAHSDGTLSLHRSLSIQQPAPSTFPTGNYATIDEGIWRARSTNVFQVISTSVVNLVTTGIPVALTGTPLARAQTTLTITISPDGKSIDISGAIALYEIDDLTFTKALIDPSTGLPFVSTIIASGKRIAFSLLDNGP